MEGNATLAQYLTVHIGQLSLDDVDPTGEECIGCGDTPWLVAKMFRGRVNEKSTDLCYLCPNCADEIEEQLYG